MGPQRSFPWWTVMRRVSALLFLALLIHASRPGVEWFRGTVAGTTVLGEVPFVDPLAALEVGLASRELMPTALLGAGILAFVALLLGPVFCGWVCPLGLLLDLAQSVRAGVNRLLPARALPALGLPRGVKYLVLAGALTFSVVTRLPVFQAFSPIQGLVRAVLYGAEVSLWFVGGILALEVIAPRLWCRSLCPLGALYAILGRWAILRVRVDPDRAGEIKCQRCESSCPMGIEVMRRYALAGHSAVDHPDCTRCGACTEACPNNVLRLGCRAIPSIEIQGR